MLPGGKMPKDFRGTAEERFWKYTYKTDGCWFWIGAINPTSGYGVFYDGRSVDAHRWSFQRFVGPIPEGNLVLHSCDIRQCVNPAHLVLGTHKANTTDAKEKGIWFGHWAKKREWCDKHLHRMTAENSSWYRGKRRCRPCYNQRMRDYRKRHSTTLR